jgi:phage-related minor tail protein
VATNNTVQYTITAKDQASAVFAQVATKAKGVGANIAESFAMVGAAAFAMRGTVKDGLGVLSGDFTKLGSLLGALPGPIGVVGQAVGDTMGRILDSTIKAADGYRKLSEKTGASIEFLSRFTEAADDVFISSESVNSALNIFASVLSRASRAVSSRPTSSSSTTRRWPISSVRSARMRSIPSSRPVRPKA